MRGLSGLVTAGHAAPPLEVIVEPRLTSALSYYLLAAGGCRSLAARASTSVHFGRPPLLYLATTSSRFSSAAAAFVATSTR